MKKILGLMLLGLMVLLVSPPALAAVDSSDNLAVVYDAGYDVPAVDVNIPSADLVSTLIPSDLGLNIELLATLKTTDSDKLYPDYDVGWSEATSYIINSKTFENNHSVYTDIPLVVPLKS